MLMYCNIFDEHYNFVPTGKWRIRKYTPYSPYNMLLEITYKPGWFRKKTLWVDSSTIIEVEGCNENIV